MTNVTPSDATAGDPARFSENDVPLCLIAQRRRDPILSMLVIPAYLGILVLDLVLFDIQAHGLPQFTVGLWIAVVSLLVIALFGIRRWRRAEEVRAKDWLACERCRGDLREVPSPGTCPRCNRPFDAYETTRRWRRVHDQPNGERNPHLRFEPGLVTQDVLEVMRESCPAVLGAGLRDPFGVWAEARLALDPARKVAARIPGKPVRLTRAILFDKQPGRNWALAMHQDRTIAVAGRVEGVRGFGAWSQKDGVWHVEAPVWLLQQMITVRLHLDDADEANGCMLTGDVPFDDHLPHKLDDGTLAEMALRARPLVVRAGDAVVMNPLVPHASGRNTSNRHRRVLHMEFAAENPGQGLRWRDEAEILGQSSSMS